MLKESAAKICTAPKHRVAELSGLCLTILAKEVEVEFGFDIIASYFSVGRSPNDLWENSCPG